MNIGAALHIVSLNRSPEENLKRLTDEYNALADRWEQANDRAEQALARERRLREAGQRLLDTFDSERDWTATDQGIEQERAFDALEAALANPAPEEGE